MNEARLRAVRYAAYQRGPRSGETNESGAPESDVSIVNWDLMIIRHKLSTLSMHDTAPEEPLVAGSACCKTELQGPISRPVPLDSI